jgi:predicted phage terminase large subunit-like protein
MLNPEEILTTADYFTLLRYDFWAFARRCFKELSPEAPFINAPYIELIVSRLEACRRGEIKRLIVNLPPRSLKSHLVSVAFTAWLLGYNPAQQIACVSYAQELSDKFARDTRRIMSSRWYKAIFATRLAERTAVADFTTTKQGVRFATSVGGQFTGRGADFIVIDDPLKPDDALSDVRRKGVLEWYDNTLLSRLNDKAEGSIIIVMQRLHQDDLVGHVLERARDDWHVVSLPAIAEENERHVIETPFGREIWTRLRGQVLNPARESLETILRIRETSGAYTFLSQYQQNPTPVEGMMVMRDWLKYYPFGELPRTPDRTVQSWDTANTPSELSDFSVCTTWAVIDRKFYLVDLCRERLNYPELKRKVVELSQRFRPDTVVIEDKASGTQLIQDLREGATYAIHAYKPPAGSNKIMRLHAQTAKFESGQVLLPAGASWLDDFLAELLSFPGGRHDDQVDSVTQALDFLQEPGILEMWRILGSQR